MHTFVDILDKAKATFEPLVVSKGAFFHFSSCTEGLFNREIDKSALFSDTIDSLINRHYISFNQHLRLKKRTEIYLSYVDHCGVFS